MRKPPSIGEPPATLFRAYDNLQHYQAFLLHGALRLRPVAYYRALEGSPRQDTSEGRGSLRVPGKVPNIRIERSTGSQVGTTYEDAHFEYASTFGNPTYMLCSSGPGVGLVYLQRKFGPHVVEIFDSTAFLEDLSMTLRSLNLGEREIDCLYCFQVRYDKGDRGEPPISAYESVRLSIAQKPAIFAPECEVRIAAILSGAQAGTPDHLDINLEHVATYARPYAGRAV